MRTYTLTAHTGNEHTDDNSVESILSAAKHGADIVEFDIMRTKITGRAVMRHSRPVPLNCPTVEDGFKAVLKTDLKVNLDVKDPTVVGAVVALAEKMGVKDRCFFTGVGREWVEQVKAQAPGMRYYLNAGVDEKRIDDDAYVNEIADTVLNCGAVGLNVHYSEMNAKMVAALHERNLEASVWTLNNLEDYKKMGELGVDNITTRFPSFEEKK